MNAGRLTVKLAGFIGGKRVLILGFGKEGRSTYRVLKEAGGYSRLDVADSNPAVSSSVTSGITIIGDKYIDLLGDYDIVFKTPGIALPWNIPDTGCIISSQADIFIGEYSAQIIGVTGTKGKSTVSTLLYHTLTSAGRDTVLAGNIGIPVFDIAGKITPDTAIVVELSCHQLEYCGHSPSSAVLLNLFEDHLDHYGTFERYARAKANIYNHQNARDVLYTHLENLPVTICTDSKVLDVSTADLPFLSFEDIGGVRLRGWHNLLNAAFAYDICRDMGIEDEKFISALRSYKPLPHRLEFVGAKNGVDFYNDSISTTVESAISAVLSVPNAKTLILGGMDRGIDYTPLVDFLLGCELSTIIGMYASGRRIYDMFLARCGPSGAKRFIYADDLFNAVKIAQKHTLPGGACLLSPASASYGNFTNFEERGDIFKELVTTSEAF